MFNFIWKTIFIQILITEHHKEKIKRKRCKVKFHFGMSYSVVDHVSNVNESTK